MSPSLYDRERSEERGREMVSFQSSISPNQRRWISDIENSPRKRKWEDQHTEELLQLKAISKPESTTSIIDNEIEFHLETPLPLEWQQCLDIQSGKVHFYNMRTHKRTSRDPRRSLERPINTNPTSLDLELNLTCESLRQNNSHDENHSKRKNPGGCLHGSTKTISTCLNKNGENSKGFPRSPYWLAFDRDEKEMAAIVCINCHLLVIVCKSSPACPNCKFVNPLNQSPPTLFKGHARSCQ